MVDSGTITVKGTFTCRPEFQGDKRIRAALISATMGFCYAARVVEASVDEITGKVTAHKVWVAVDVGKALNPLARWKGQTQGGVWMGMGRARCRRSSMTKGQDVARQHPRLPGPHHDGPRHRGDHRRASTPTARSAPREASEGMLAGFLPAVQEAV